MWDQGRSWESECHGRHSPKGEKRSVDGEALRETPEPRGVRSSGRRRAGGDGEEDGNHPMPPPKLRVRVIGEGDGPGPSWAT